MFINSIVFLFMTFMTQIHVKQCSQAIQNNKNQVGVYEPFFRFILDKLSEVVGYTGHDKFTYNYNLNKNLLQPQMSNDTKWVCDGEGLEQRSKIVPDSVHKLRPGDIDIVGALGDSLTAANGAMAIAMPHLIQQNRGLSPTIGGQGTWRQFLTLPNILKEYNPNLYGYSLGDSRSNEKMAKFNTAAAAATTSDMPYMAKVLVQRILSDPDVDIQNQWKLITVFVGANDFCNICFKKNLKEALAENEKSLLKTLRILRDALPKTMVNVGSALDVRVVKRQIGRSKRCDVALTVECPCLFAKQFSVNYFDYVDVIDKWQEKEREIVDLPEFNRKDFTVNLQEFTKHITPFYLEDGTTDFSYFSKDCFHLSQKGMAAATGSLWSNMFEPYNNKSSNWSREFENIKCPTRENPYIRTREN